jgi:hypothetical protein
MHKITTQDKKLTMYLISVTHYHVREENIMSIFRSAE